MPDFNPVQLEGYVRQRAPEITRGIQVAAKKARNEAELVSIIEKVLERFAANFDVQLNLYKERTLINGRADAVYNRMVIEYEPPNSLRKSNVYQANKHAIGQVQQYMQGLERIDRQKKERLAGVVLDGGFYIFIRYRDDRWAIDDPLPVAPHSTETFLRYLLSLSTELALTPENLVRDFGENSNTARWVVPVLYSALTNGIAQAEQENRYRKVRVLFQQWQHQFREVSGYDPASGQLEPAELARLYAVKDKSPDLEKLFFTIHTYYAAFIKLLALQVAHYYLMPRVGSGLAAAANYDSDKLRHWLQELERGGLFGKLGIRNFLEGDFFGWYLDIWDEALESALKRLIGDLANYSLVTLDVDPEETRDLLKQLYQNLMPKKLRHALGEYYTPDWLAERLLNQLGYDGNPATRILDPACGSGTFPVLEIKRARKYIEDRMLPPRQALEKILENIVGFDLNPLAVISARTNYLLALGDLLEHREGDITIPIYLADSILTPSLETGQLDFLGAGNDMKIRQPGFAFKTSVGRFSVPRSLVQAQLIDKLADLLEECVHVQAKPDIFRARLLHDLPLKEPDDTSEIEIAIELYQQLLSLEQKGINGIWARIIKNAFAPLFQPKFDYIAGNPPWVNWENLPEDYRRETFPLWSIYDLFPHKGFDAILGKAKDDISILMTYVCLDKYLHEKGQLGFIITQSVFKTAGAGQGFRRFRLDKGRPLKVKAVDDMVNIKPFEGAANRTAIFIVERGSATKYPVPYSLWYKPAGGSVIPEDLTLEEIIRGKIASYRQFVAQPVDEHDLTSSWISGRPLALKAIQKLLGKSDYKAQAGVCTWLNGVYWVDILNHSPDGSVVISNITERAKIAVENIQAAIEPDLLYPLLKGRDVNRWSAAPSAQIIVTHEPGRRLKAIPEDNMMIRFSKTYAYFKHFEAPLRERSGYKRYFRETDPFYSVFDIGDYTFAPFKVVWPNIASELACAVVDDVNGKCIVPQHIVTLVAFDDEDEAHFVCAVLNSAPVNFALQSYSQKGGKSFGTPHVLENIQVPRFDEINDMHSRLGMLSKKAHAATSAGDIARLEEIEAEVNSLAAQLWGLTDEELKEIQESLAELQ